LKDDSISEELTNLQIRFVVLTPPHPEQIRAETGLIGLNPADWVDGQGRLSGRFARSFAGRTGMWASTAPIGASGPFNLTLRGRFRQVDPSTRSVEAEVLLLEYSPPESH